MIPIPLKDRVVIRPSADDEKIGNIFIPDNAKNKNQFQQGVVLRIGKKVNEVNVGDKILYDKFSTSDLRVDGVQCFIIEEPNILAILE